MSMLSQGVIHASEILDDQLSVVDSSRRNRSLKVLRSGPQRSLFVKFGRPVGDGRDSERERRFYRAVEADAELAPVARFLALPDHPQRSDTFLSLELVVEATSAYDAFYTGWGFEKPILSALGFMIGTMHKYAPLLLERAGSRIGVTSDLPWALSAEPCVGDQRRYARAGALRVLDLVFSDPELVALLRQVKHDWAPSGLIHGDLKWDNCLIYHGNGEAAIKLVDWEAVQYGDLAWDLAGMLHDFYLAWTCSLPRTEGASLAELLECAAYPLEHMKADIGSFWRSYVVAAETPDPEALAVRAIRFSGARLLEAAFQRENQSASLSRHTTMLLELCRNLIRDPERARIEFIGT